MAYFYINGVDYSQYISGLTISKEAIYNSQTNASGGTVVDYVGSKREIEVATIPLNDVEMLKLQQAIAPFNVKISFRNPATNTLEENVNVIIPDDEADFYTIQANKVLFNAGKLTFIEL